MKPILRQLKILLRHNNFRARLGTKKHLAILVLKHSGQKQILPNTQGETPVDNGENMRVQQLDKE